MDKFQSLADYLGAGDAGAAADDPTPGRLEFDSLLSVKDAKEFCRKLCSSELFRRFVLDGLMTGALPPAIATRLMDHGIGKPVERVEHTGKDGDPIVTEVRRVIIRADAQDVLDEPSDPRPELMH